MSTSPREGARVKPHSDFVSMREARKLLGCSSKDVHTWMCSRRLRWHRRGLSVVFDRADIERLKGKR